MIFIKCKKSFDHFTYNYQLGIHISYNYIANDIAKNGTDQTLIDHHFNILIA